MLSYIAITLNSGGVVRHAETNEVMNLHLGEFETLDLAIESASELFNCHHVMNGVIIKGNNTGGHLVMDTQEFSEL